MFDYLIIGCGLTGSVISRELAEQGYQVEIWDRRKHVGGNMYDHVDEYGVLVQDYGPHAFHTKSKEIYNYICKYEQWKEYHLTCGASWDEKCTPTPFNFSTIDSYYSPEKAASLKIKLKEAFSGRITATVIEVLSHSDKDIREYGQFLFDNDYSLYTAKQWGVSPDEIDPSVLKRVPLRFSYDEGYFDDEYQVMPVHSFTHFFNNILNHNNIRVKLGIDALSHIKIQDGVLKLDGNKIDRTIIYTGALDELFECRFGRLPYRSLKFEWKHIDACNIQKYPIVAYPKEAGFTRITEYNKLPIQQTIGTTYAVEYPLPYKEGKANEPYYPVLTEDSQKTYVKYKDLANSIPGLVCCGRLADFKYYNMDQALDRALQISRNVMCVSNLHNK